jgi:N-acylglucosamine 2-epimerase
LTGGYPDGCDGRLGVPGHALIPSVHSFSASNNERLKDAAIKQFIEKPFEYGWDKEYGGLYYFLDKENNSPLQLEWNMKLWWVHCEAMIASLMAYKYTEELKHWELFKKVLNYVMKHFPDNENGGEWFGYLTREGKVNQSFKGGPFKGCYHTPRCLMMCRKMLLELQSHK